ncbi:MAG TPA: type II secretion system minor pseudopilin GspJ [Novosphingobium sp.]|nr:type II secretion system minor pseudopilin GspJ [Novosphingobium sp.]
MTRRNGFTLVEMLIALALFAMIAGGALALLRFSVDAEAASRTRTESLAATRRFLSVLGADLAQAVPRPVRDTGGAEHSAFEAPSGAPDGVILALTRSGWSNFDGAPRPSLQRVEYRWQGGKLSRAGHPFLDGALADPPAPLADSPAPPSLRFRTADGVWRDRWEPQRIAELPVAIELTLAQPRGEPLRVVALVGVNYQ